MATQIKLQQIIQDGAATGDVITWDGSKWVPDTGGAQTLVQAFVEGFAGTTIDLDANNGTVKDAAGNNIAFTTPLDLDNLQVYKNGIKLDRNGATTRDYSINSSTHEITFTATITAQDSLTFVKGATVTISSSGEANTASNVGTGEGVFKQKSGTNLEFKSLVAGANITLTNNANDITIASTGGSGITSLNALTAATQTFATGTSGTDFNINSTGTVHTFNIPSASSSNRGLVTTGSQSFSGAKTFNSAVDFDGIATFNARADFEESNTSNDGGLNLVSGVNLNTVKIRVPSSPSNWTLTLPGTAGSNGQVLTTDGTGVTSWSTMSSGGITTLNTLTGATQTFATGTTGSDFNISSSGTTHTFNIPNASTANRGLVNTSTQSFSGIKTFTDPLIAESNFEATGGSEFRNAENSTGGGLDIISSVNNGRIKLRTPSSPSNWTFTFPVNGGTNGQVLTTNGSGTTSWSTISGSGITSLNGLTGATQTFAIGTSGSDFNISSSGTTHTFNIPDAGQTERGLINTTSQIIWGMKTFQSSIRLGHASNQGSLTLSDGDGGLISIFAPYSSVSSYNLSLPPNAGTNKRVLTTNGSGTTSWSPLMVQVTGKTVVVGDWSLVSGIYEASISDSNITADSFVVVVPNNADIDICKTAELLPRNESSANSVKIFAKNLPSASITFTLVIQNLPL